MSCTFLSIRNTDSVPKGQVEDLISLSLLPFIDVSYPLACSFFADCMSGYDDGVGTLFVLQGKKHPQAFAFVFDQAPVMNSAPHLHICSAFHLYKGTGSVSDLLHTIIELNNGRLTLECQPELLSYFEKVGFHIDEQCQLNNDYIKMATIDALSHNLFYKPELNDSQRESYKGQFDAALKRLEQIGFIRTI